MSDKSYEESHSLVFVLVNASVSEAGQGDPKASDDVVTLEATHINWRD